MAGEVIEALGASGITTILTEAEVRALATVGRGVKRQAGLLFDAGAGDGDVYILRRGRVALHISMQTDGSRCGGDVTTLLAAQGDVFGWAAWVRPERIAVTATAMETTSLVVLALDRLRQSPLYWKVSQWMVYRLFALMQEAGLCPPNIQGLLELKDMHVWTDTPEPGLKTGSGDVRRDT